MFLCPSKPDRLHNKPGARFHDSTNVAQRYRDYKESFRLPKSQQPKRGRYDVADILLVYRHGPHSGSAPNLPDHKGARRHSCSLYAAGRPECSQRLGVLSLRRRAHQGPTAPSSP
ncbi:hypothetical protein EVA_15106 [gut metagenome]|uniref:Uncharacterized protein n=1 Tax=gut metagenome TaxID=749906 RepID=J9FPB4_9ZZZZ